MAREEKGREGKGREEKGREGKRREGKRTVIATRQNDKETQLMTEKQGPTQQHAVTALQWSRTLLLRQHCCLSAAVAVSYDSSIVTLPSMRRVLVGHHCLSAILPATRFRTNEHSSSTNHCTVLRGMVSKAPSASLLECLFPLRHRA